MGVVTAGKAVLDDHPLTCEAHLSSRYVKIGDDLFVSIPGASSIDAPTEGEVFADEVITVTGI